MDRIFKLTFCYGRSHIAGPSELSIRFLLDENPLLYLAARAGERSGGRDATALFFAPSFMTLFSTNAEAMKKVILPRKEDRFYREEKWSIRHRIELYDATV